MNRVRRVLPRGIRARTTTVVVVTLVALLVPGVWLARARIYASQLEATRALARDEIDRLLDLTAQNTRLTGIQGDLPYELVVGDGTLVASSPELSPFEPGGRPFMPAPGQGDPQPLYRVWPVAFPQAAGSPLSGLRIDALDGSINGSFVLGDVARNGRPGQAGAQDRYRVYVFVTPSSARTAVAKLDSDLRVGLPAGVLAVAAMTWWIVGRPLRTVERIRREAEAITLADLDRRLPIPTGRDEVTALVTTWNQTLERLDDAKQQHRRFIADAAHELRSPLAALMTVIEVAQAYPDPDRSEHALTQAHTIGSRLQSLIDDLLLLARMDGDEPLLREWFDLREIAAQALQPPATLRDGPPVLVHADRHRLQRAANNLLANAVRHAHSVVEVRCGTVKDRGQLIVVNDGPPIPVDQGARIFQRFVRLDEARDRDSGGSGLGLAIVHEIARRHEGKAYTIPQDAGAVFILELPLTGTTPLTAS